ncbi:uncharacterized protein LOC123012424 [Tribolium madens]|uniref:uncharacterized protein LOC123012424 n=1 Tax=Tribolium madens TaxID=41895 RepID=UPI001CF75D58|nr:uncharacterized protein LOC123012424 [Tribolium madens]
MFRLIGITLLLGRLCLAQHLLDESVFTVNGKKALHIVSDKFLSFSIDPAVLLTGLNLSDTTLQMAKRLSPAYIRIAGPSTHYVKYQEENSNEVENGNVAVTPTMWFGINEWLASANLTPVFGINDRETTRDGWNPQDAMPLLDISDKFNVSCYWQLGYDCTNKSEGQYETDLKRLQHVLDAFPDNRERWKIIGSDLRRCVTDTKRILDNMDNVLAAAILEPTTKSDTIYLQQLNEWHILPKVPLWTVSPKSAHPVSFDSAISWAKQLGEAAKIGYQVILRQPRLHEIYSETPPYWVSAMHKNLMGRNVLDVKPTIGHSGLSVYAHCTKHQNDFIRSGAMTVLVVNNCTTNHTLLLKFGTVLLKNTEVQSYILTSEDSTNVLLNGERLSMDKYTGDKLNVLPKLRRARIMNYLSLFVPPKSVAFFVLPGAQIPICANEENDLKQLIEEISEDQNIPFSEEVSVDINSRLSERKTPSLHELHEVMMKELESDERFYKQLKMKKKNVHEGEARKFFIDQTKHKHFDDYKRPKHKDEETKKIFELELTSAEIRKVLADRAKAKAAKKHIIFTSEELEEIMDKATEKILNSKNAAIRIRKKSKREAPRDKKDINMRLLKLKTLGDNRRKLLRETFNKRKAKSEQKREKRDINMDLLKLKTEMLHPNTNKSKKLKKKVFENREEKQATIREPGQTSDEFVQFEEEKEESPLPDGDVFADLADPDEVFLTTEKPSKFGLKTFFNKPKPKIEVQPIKFEPSDLVVEDDFEVNSDFDDNNENEYYDCIHEFFGKRIPEEKQMKNSSELWEVGLIEEKTDNHLPALHNRGFAVNEAELDSQKSEVKHDDFVENDYEDLDSDESSPLRKKRSINELSADTKFYYILGQGYDPTKLKIDDNLKEQQFKILKDHLANRKKLDFITRNNELVHQHKVRSLQNRNFLVDKYKSLAEGFKVWKPSDILTLKNPTGKKSKRSLDHDADSVENEIGSFMNEIIKNTEMIQPKLDRENGDYQLVFPNKDKIEVVEKNGDAELKLVLHGGESTCPTTEKVEESTRTNIQKITKKVPDNVWDKLFRKLSKFFQGLSSKLRKYIMDDLLK